MQMQDFIKIVGNGRKTARDMTYEEASAAMTLILEGKASEGQTAAFMAALRIKEESGTELAAFAATLRRYCRTVKAEQPKLVDLGLPYDGRSKSLSLTPAAACIAAATGAAVAMHGRPGPTTPPKFGLGVGDTLAALGIEVGTTPEEAARLLENPAVGLAFVSTARFAPYLEEFNRWRLDYGLRSFFNSIEKLLNPFGAPVGLAGVFHGPVLSKVAETLAGQGFRRGLAVHGPEGSLDVLTSRTTRLVEFGGPGSGSRDELNTWLIDPADFGWRTPSRPESAYAAPNQPANSTEAIDGEPALPSLSAQENAELTLRLLNRKEPDVRLQHSALLSAGLLIYAAGCAGNLKDAVALAEEALFSGEALARLESWRKASCVTRFSRHVKAGQVEALPKVARVEFGSKMKEAYQA
ncbi:MAG TPA: hypothetical protein VH186_00175 [Chloroflexia bacterium]|nr:hypothetical protein [Chloroflexia bacterium]